MELVSLSCGFTEERVSSTIQSFQDPLWFDKGRELGMERGEVARDGLAWVLMGGHSYGLFPGRGHMRQ